MENNFIIFKIKKQFYWNYLLGKLTGGYLKIIKE